jgi:hypothetical protein
MKKIKFAALILAGSLALAANNVQAAAAAYPISISFTTYNQVTSTDTLGVITYSTTSTTWNNATILAKLTAIGITLPPGAHLAVIKGGDIVLLDSAGNIGLSLQDVSADNYYVDMYFYNISAAVTTVKSAKLSSTVQFAGTAEFHADFESYTNAVADTAVVKHGGFEASTYDAFDFFTLAMNGSYTTAGNDANAYNSNLKISGNLTASGPGEYYHFDPNSGDIYQPADTTLSVPLISGLQSTTLLYQIYNYNL